MQINETVVLKQGDFLGFNVFSTVNFNMPVATLGGIGTRFVVRYLSAK